MERLCLLLLVATVYIGRADDAKGQNCCPVKEVGGTTYIYAYHDEKTTRDLQCKNGCVYTKENDSHGEPFCFKPGKHNAKCLELGKCLPGSSTKYVCNRLLGDPVRLGSCWLVSKGSLFRDCCDCQWVDRDCRECDNYNP